ncbi:TetR/AcrR family transcriptional regulator [Stakelama tenebrarum]|uniref:TetR family transcriptional regulator n=1 Tax=Stakelama tenebrarum TaxID=2711215 RepID=A0A6G6Y5H1_9SPHN|nr:TetR family transcriptional regulator C-terminal domain-containing protein [Sphingosinithalassobacter tenebrarum]QIG80165.1 TetR family transcriptional regulator [Sphingosinithalassobacter tenebrarum]
MMAKDSKEAGKTAAKPRRRATRQAPTVRRQDLLEVTIRCLANLGARGTTGREVCRQAGVSHGLLRHYFKNPQNLLYETYEELCDRFLEQLEAELDVEQPDPWLYLDGFFNALFSNEWASSDLLGAYMAFWSLARTNPEFAEKSEQFNARLRELLAAAMERLPRNEGALPFEDAVPIMSATMDGLWLDFCLSPTRTPRDRAITLCNRTLRQLFPHPGDAAAQDAETARPRVRAVS